MDMQALIDQYLEHLRLERKSPHTILTYGYSLRQWGAFAQGPGDYETVLRYLDKYENQVTRFSEWMRIRCFIKHLASRGACQDWTEKVVMRVKRKPRHTVLTQEESDRVLSACDDSWAGRRNYTMLALYLCTGARRDEIRTLKACDVDIESGKFTNHCKGGQRETFHLSSFAREALWKWIPLHGDGPYLFPGRKYRNTPVSRKAVMAFFYRLFDQAGVSRQKAHPHSMRHTAAQRLLEAGLPLETVAKCLHHRSLSSTVVYAQVRDQTAALALERVFGSPLGSAPELAPPQRFREAKRITAADVADWL